MIRPRLWLLLLRHTLLLWRTGQLRFRLETFGVYYPSLPYERPWWKVNPRYGLMLVRRANAYACWLADMQQVRQRAAKQWRNDQCLD